MDGNSLRNNHPGKDEARSRLTGKTWKANRTKVFTTWFLIPVGVMTMLLLIMGVDLLIELTGISFPASVPFPLSRHELIRRLHVCLGCLLFYFCVIGLLGSGIPQRLCVGWMYPVDFVCDG